MASPLLPPSLIAIHTELGIPAQYASTTKLPLYQQAPLSALVVAQLDDAGRPIVLTKDAALAWCTMVEAAAKDQISLMPFSGFRSYLYQRGLLIAQLKKGLSIQEILTSLAAPGFSEHHTGEALDITTPGCPQAKEIFETTSAYQWLTQHGATFGFRQSFGKNNPHGFIFEPWHWKFHH
jgi:D-alanyl-D-alanine carboxypeptidase